MSLVFILGASILVPVEILARQEAQEEELPSPKTALIKSAIVPGWGQFYNGKVIKGAAFFSTQVFIGYQFFRYHDRLHKTTGEERKQQVEYTRNTWAWRYLAVYLLCITDAYVDAHLAGFPEDDNLSLKLQPIPWGMKMSLNIRFSSTN